MCVCVRKVAMLEGEDGIHLRNLALHPAANEEEGKPLLVKSNHEVLLSFSL